MAVAVLWPQDRWPSDAPCMGGDFFVIGKMMPGTRKSPGTPSVLFF